VYQDYLRGLAIQVDLGRLAHLGLLSQVHVEFALQIKHTQPVLFVIIFQHTVVQLLNIYNKQTDEEAAVSQRSFVCVCHDFVHELVKCCFKFKASENAIHMYFPVQV